jgi:hypothetical protein
MRHNTMTIILKMILLLTLVAAWPSQAQPRTLVLQPDTALDPLLDPVNEAVSNNSIAALVVRLDISGNTVLANDIRVVRIPVSRAKFGENNALIVIHAFNDDDDLVGRTSASDRRMNARDGETVIVDDRSVSVIVPLVSRPNDITVTMPSTSALQRFSVSSAIQDYCSDYGTDPVCSNDPPRASRYFSLLHPPDP